jgi:multicomponent Na+:H+ antiporter subunit D
MAIEHANHVALSLQEQLPIWLIVIPFITAPLILLLGNKQLAWLLSFIATGISLFISILLTLHLQSGGVISYHIGGWAPPIGIEYRIDATNAFILLLISSIGTVVLPYACKSVNSEINPKHHTLFYACYMLCFTGLMGIVITGDAFNIFVFLEISSLATYVLVAMGAYKDKRALTAAYDYLILGTIGATFFVIGIGFLYMATGTLNLVDLAERISSQGLNRTIRAGFGFIVIGLGLKIAIMPLHLWLPKAYTFAPSAVTVFLSATATKASMYVLLKFLFSIYHPSFAFEENTILIIFMPLAIATMFLASIVAIFQTNLKRMLAYSSIGQIGYLLLGASLMNSMGLTATLVHMFNHGITKALLFMGAGILALKVGKVSYENIAGLGRSMPLTAAAMVVGGLSLIGVPGTAGFISKWLLIQAAFANGWWQISLLIVVSSLLSVVYVWRFFEILYIAPNNKMGMKTEASASMLIPMWILAFACLFFGIFTDLTLGTAQTAAENLLSLPNSVLQTTLGDGS